MKEFLYFFKFVVIVFAKFRHTTLTNDLENITRCRYEIHFFFFLHSLSQIALANQFRQEKASVVKSFTYADDNFLPHMLV